MSMIINHCEGWKKNALYATQTILRATPHSTTITSNDGYHAKFQPDIGLNKASLHGGGYEVEEPSTANQCPACHRRGFWKPVDEYPTTAKSPYRKPWRAKKHSDSQTRSVEGSFKPPKSTYRMMNASYAMPILWHCYLPGNTEQNIKRGAIYSRVAPYQLSCILQADYSMNGRETFWPVQVDL
jgi:hypothetical protein